MLATIIPTNQVAVAAEEDANANQAAVLVAIDVIVVAADDAVDLDSEDSSNPVRTY